MKALYVTFILLFVSSVGIAQPAVPALREPVMDTAGLLSRSSRAQLNSILQSLSDKSTTQLAVLTVQSLEGIPIESYSMQVVESWKLGQAKSDRGVLLLVAIRDRKMRIEVGQGLEGDLPDAYAARIIDQMKPLMKAGAYDQALQFGVVSILERVEPKFLESGEVSELRKGLQSAGYSKYMFFIFVLFFLAISFLGKMNRFERGLRGRRSSGLAGALLGYGLGSSGRGGWHGGGGGFGGGGFGGGGGGFSGGGASGGW